MDRAGQPNFSSSKAKENIRCTPGGTKLSSHIRFEVPLCRPQPTHLNAPHSPQKSILDTRKYRMRCSQTAAFTEMSSRIVSHTESSSLEMADGFDLDIVEVVAPVQKAPKDPSLHLLKAMNCLLRASKILYHSVRFA